MDKPDHSIFPALETGQSWQGKKIGLLGGSFNPAHAAHVEISLAALERLELDAVWWLVSPQNPLKSTEDMAAFEDRLQSAQAMASDPRIFVSDLENHLGTHYSADTLAALLPRLEGSDFVWLMGADNLIQFTEWKDWEKIVAMVPFAIFDRPSYSGAAEKSLAAMKYKHHRLPEDEAQHLIYHKPPKWVYCTGTDNPLSSTMLRLKGAKDQEVTYTNVSTTLESEDVGSSKKPASPVSLQALIMNCLEDNKAEEILEIDLKGKTSIADSMFIASGRSTRQVAAIADHLRTQIKHAGFDSPKVEGLEKADWVLIDAGDAIVHIFRPEVRSFYNLEKMWTADFTPDNILNSPES